MTNENVWDCQLILKYNNYTYLFNVQNHNKIKNKVLKEIDKTPSTKTQGVYKTDWKQTVVKENLLGKLRK